LREPCCAVHALNQLAAAACPAGALPLPPLALLRASADGVQITSAAPSPLGAASGEPPSGGARVLRAWGWADIAFWRFETQGLAGEKAEGAEEAGDLMDVLVLGAHPVAQPHDDSLAPGHAPTITVLEMETEVCSLSQPAAHCRLHAASSHATASLVPVCKPLAGKTAAQAFKCPPPPSSALSPSQEADEIYALLESNCPTLREPLPPAVHAEHMACGTELSCFEVRWH
jgi:hypothetical protein